MNIIDTDLYRKASGGRGLSNVENALTTPFEKEKNDAYQHTRGVLALNACLDVIKDELAAGRISTEGQARLEGLAFEMTLTGFAKQGTASENDPLWEKIISELSETFQPNFKLLGRLTGLLAEAPYDSAHDELNPQNWISF